MIKTRIAIVAALCTAGLFAAPTAFAASREVSFNDLDLTTVEGQKILDTRLDRAARSVCKVARPTTGTLLNSDIDRNCYRQALGKARGHMASAVDKVQDSRLGG